MRSLENRLDYKTGPARTVRAPPRLCCAPLRVAALSDFHIGSLERTDSFGHAAAGFLDYLDALEARHDRIVLLGDVFQAEHGPWLGSRGARAELERARRRVPALWERLRGDRYVYIHGNHDAVAGQVLDARTSWRLDEDGFRVFFIHGHQFDPLLRSLYPLARMSTWMMGRVRRLGLRDVAQWFEHKDIVLKHERFRGPHGPYARAAARLFDEEEADAVVMGHTHMPDRLELEGGIFANTGSCSMGQRMHVSIDTQARTVELVRD